MMAILLFLILSDLLDWVPNRLAPLIFIVAAIFDLAAIAVAIYCLAHHHVPAEMMP